MSCPQTMILQVSILNLLRRRAWNKSPVTISRLNTCNRVKTTNPEYKEYLARLNRVETFISDSQGYAGHQQQVFIQLCQKGGVLCQTLSSYSLLVSESLLLSFSSCLLFLTCL